MVSGVDSPNTSGGNYESLSPSDTPNPQLAPPPGPRRPIPRKGHTKSRRGCFNCKKRKIKCQESKPECGHCMKAGLRCLYPEATPKALRESSSSDNQMVQHGDQGPQPMMQLQATPGIFTLSDMRLFYHFMTTGYPHLPLETDGVWISTIPAIAHQYDYLMHSLLALSASHLQALSPGCNLTRDALTHRVLAVQSLNAALSKPSSCRDEADARMAASLALTFQASYLEDGLSEFLNTLRGCNLIASGDEQLDEHSAFIAFRSENHIATMRNKLPASGASPVNRQLIREAEKSIDAVQALCRSNGERSYQYMLAKTVRAAYGAPVDCYASFVGLYGWPTTQTHEEFQAFLHPSNHVAQVLLAHFIALQQLLSPVLVYERLENARASGPTSFITWLVNICEKIPPFYKPFVEWPKSVARLPWYRFFEPQHFPPQFGSCPAPPEPPVQAQITEIPGTPPVTEQAFNLPTTTAPHCEWQFAEHWQGHEAHLDVREHPTEHSFPLIPQEDDDDELQLL